MLQVITGNPCTGLNQNPSGHSGCSACSEPQTVSSRPCGRGCLASGREVSVAATTRAAPRRRVTDGGLAAVLEGSPGLVSLQLYWNLKVGDATLRQLAAWCPSLAALSLSGCKGVTDRGVAALAGGCRHLTDLDLTR